MFYLEKANLIIEGKPGDVDLAGGTEKSRWDPIYLPRTVDDQVALEGRIEGLVGAEKGTRENSKSLTYKSKTASKGRGG